MNNYDQICKKLFELIPKDEWERLNGTLGEMCSEFLVFCDTYYHLSKIIPKDWTVIDFGAANNPQSYFFTEHKKYIAVNPISDIPEENGMFCPLNCEIYRMTTGEFIKTVDYPKEKVFAVCNFVPDWHGENSMELVRKNFKNCYTFYPD
jgi:hypothetical protein